MWCGYCFWLTILYENKIWEHNSKGCPWPFLMLSLTFQVCPFQMYTQEGSANRRMGSWISDLVSVTLPSAGGPQWYSESPGTDMSSEPGSNNPWNIWVFSFLSDSQFLYNMEKNIATAERFVVRIGEGDKQDSHRHKVWLKILMLLGFLVMATALFKPCSGLVHLSSFRWWTILHYIYFLCFCCCCCGYCVSSVKENSIPWRIYNS